MNIEMNTEFDRIVKFAKKIGYLEGQSKNNYAMIAVPTSEQLPALREQLAKLEREFILKFS